MAHDVFISYGREDMSLMQQVEKALREAGLTIWTDRGIAPGSPSWKAEIEKAILDSRCIVVLFSPDSAESRWVRAELDYADAQRKPIYPLLVRGDSNKAIPFGFTSYQWIDVRDASQLNAGLARLIAVLKGDQANLSVSALPVEKAIQVRPRLMIPIAIGMILAGLVLGTILLISIPQTTAVSTPTLSESADAALTQPTALPTMPPFNVPEKFKKLEGEKSIIAIPDKWTSSIDSSILTDTIKTMLGSKEEAVDVAQKVLQNMDVFAVELFSFQGVLITVEDFGIPMSYKLLEARTQTLNQQFDISGTSTSRGLVEMPAGTMLVQDSTMTGDINTFAVSYYLIRNSLVYTIGFVGRATDQEAVRSSANQIIQTFRVKE